MIILINAWSASRLEQTNNTVLSIYKKKLNIKNLSSKMKDFPFLKKLKKKYIYIYIMVGSFHLAFLQNSVTKENPSSVGRSLYCLWFIRRRCQIASSLLDRFLQGLRCQGPWQQTAMNNEKHGKYMEMIFFFSYFA